MIIEDPVIIPTELFEMLLFSIMAIESLFAKIPWLLSVILLLLMIGFEGPSRKIPITSEYLMTFPMISGLADCISIATQTNSIMLFLTIPSLPVLNTIPLQYPLISWWDVLLNVKRTISFSSPSTRKVPFTTSRTLWLNLTTTPGLMIRVSPYSIIKSSSTVWFVLQIVTVSSLLLVRLA